MARYRTIDIRIWGDEKFKALSSPHPNAQTLFFFFLTGPFTGPIPGIYSAGEAALAERLGWPMEGLLEGFREGFSKGFREAFAEVSREGLVKADWGAHLIYIPNAIKFNKPTSPNVIRSWSDTWDELPECELKVEAWEGFRLFFEACSEPYRKAFAESCRKPSLKASRKPSPKTMANQEQEQEQEQEHIPTDALFENRTAKSHGVSKSTKHPSGVELPQTLNASKNEIESFLKYRSEIKKPLKDQGQKALFSKLVRMQEAGIDIRAALLESMSNGWQGVFEPKGAFQARQAETLNAAAERIADEIILSKGKA